MHVILWTPHTYIYMAVKLKVEWIKQPSEPAELSSFQLQVFMMLMWSGASSSTMKQVPRMSERARAVLEEQNEQSQKQKGDDKHLKAVMAKKTHTQDQTSSDGKDSMSPFQASTPSLQDIQRQATVEDIPDDDDDDFFTSRVMTIQDESDKAESTNDELSTLFHIFMISLADNARAYDEGLEHTHICILCTIA